MSNAAATAGASPPDHDWAIGSLPCTKSRMKGGPRILDLSKIIVFILPEQLLSATRCRVDCDRINAGVVALGGSLPLIAAERPP